MMKIWKGVCREVRRLAIVALTSSGPYVAADISGLFTSSLQLPTTLASHYSSKRRHSERRRTNFAENSRLGFERLLTNRSESVAPHQKSKSNFALQYCDVETITAC